MPLPVQHAVVPYVWCCVRADLHAGHGVLALGHSPSCKCAPCINGISLHAHTSEESIEVVSQYRWLNLSWGDAQHVRGL